MAERLLPQLRNGDVRLIVQSNFNIPGGEPGMADARAALAACPNTEVLDRSLEDDEYGRHMAETHLVLLPYQADRYVARTSGILAEAIHAGVPMVVPDGTWLSEQLRRHGAGVAFDPWQTDGFAHAVDRALERLPELLTRAAERRAAFIGFHSPERLARFVCGAAILERAAAFGSEGRVTLASAGSPQRMRRDSRRDVRGQIDARILIVGPLTHAE
jgi:glycosyltransferase involved in cell wall biosynthesis